MQSSLFTAQVGFDQSSVHQQQTRKVQEKAGNVSDYQGCQGELMHPCGATQWILVLRLSED